MYHWYYSPNDQWEFLNQQLNVTSEPRKLRPDMFTMLVGVCAGVIQSFSTYFFVLIIEQPQVPADILKRKTTERPSKKWKINFAIFCGRQGKFHQVNTLTNAEVETPSSLCTQDYRLSSFILNPDSYVVEVFTNMMAAMFLNNNSRCSNPPATTCTKCSYYVELHNR